MSDQQAQELTERACKLTTTLHGTTCGGCGTHVPPRTQHECSPLAARAPERPDGCEEPECGAKDGIPCGTCHPSAPIPAAEAMPGMPSHLPERPDPLSLRVGTEGPLRRLPERPDEALREAAAEMLVASSRLLRQKVQIGSEHGRALAEAEHKLRAALAATGPAGAIPDAMVEAAAEAIFHDDLKDEGGGTWESHDDGEKAPYRSNARAALEAAVAVSPSDRRTD